MSLFKVKAIWANFEDFKNKELNASSVYDDRYIKTKIRAYGDNVYTNFRGLNVQEEDIECKSVTVISIDSLLEYENKSYLEVHLENYAYKIIEKQITCYLDNNLVDD